jgi:hypothetical protein
MIDIWAEQAHADPMTTDRYRVPVEQLEQESRVPRQEQVARFGDGMAPPPVPLVGPAAGEPEGDGD